MQSRGLDPRDAVVVARSEPAGEAEAHALASRSARRRSTSSASASPTASAAARAGPPPGRPLSGPARLRSGAQFALPAADGAVRDPCVRAREAIEPVLLRGREAKLLDQPSGRPALLVEGIAFAADGVPVEFARATSVATEPATTSSASLCAHRPPRWRSRWRVPGSLRLAGTGRLRGRPDGSGVRGGTHHARTTRSEQANPESQRGVPCSIDSRLSPGRRPRPHRRGVRAGHDRQRIGTSGGQPARGQPAGRQPGGRVVRPGQPALVLLPRHRRGPGPDPCRGRGRRGLRREARRQQPEVRGRDVRPARNTLSTQIVRQRSGHRRAGWRGRPGRL